jgi:hypothetical protein
LKDWGVFEWVCVLTTVLILGGIVVYSMWVLNGIS